jgi:hypothetical protein
LCQCVSLATHKHVSKKGRYKEIKKENERERKQETTNEKKEGMKERMAKNKK